MEDRPVGTEGPQLTPSPPVDRLPALTRILARLTRSNGSRTIEAAPLDGIARAASETRPTLAAAVEGFAKVARVDDALDPQTTALIDVALCSSVAGFDAGRLRAAVRVALQAGASREQLLDVFALTSIIGMHTGSVGVPSLVSALQDQGDDVLASPLEGRAQELWSEHIEGRRYWNSFLDVGEFGVFMRGLATIDPAFFEAYIELSLEPWRFGVLEPKTRELIYIAIDSVTTHLYRPGLDAHMRGALSFGATKAEIMAVLKLAAQTGLRTISEGTTILAEELLTDGRGAAE